MFFFEDGTVFEKESIVLVVISIWLRVLLRGGLDGDIPGWS